MPTTGDESTMPDPGFARRLTAHELARQLLAGPDLPVVREVGHDNHYKQVVWIDRWTLPEVEDRCFDPNAVNHVFYARSGTLPAREVIRLD